MIDDAFVQEIVDSIKLESNSVYVLSSRYNGYFFLYRDNLQSFCKWLKESISNIFSGLLVKCKNESGELFFTDGEGCNEKSARLRMVDLSSFVYIQKGVCKYSFIYKKGFAND